MIILATQVSAFAAQDLLWGPAFSTFPDLEVAWSEAGIGWISFYLDPAALKIRHDIGIDIIAWECDYPHSDSIWPDAPEAVMSEMIGAGVPDDASDKITWPNTCRHFRYDAFAHIPRAEASVGVLRAQSPDVDTSVRSRKEWAERYAARAGVG